MTARLNPEYLEIPELTTNPSTPSTGSARLFVKNDGTINVILDTGSVVDLTASGTTSLDALSDTNIATLQDGQYLKYLSSPGEWVNATPQLNDMDDVTIAAPSNGQALVYSGTVWQNQAVATSLDSLTDTTLTTPEQGDMLIRDGTDFKNLPYSPTVHAILERTNLNKLLIYPSNAPNSGEHIVDLGMSDYLHTSLGAGSLTTVLNTTETAFRTPVGADNAMGIISGFFVFNAANYFGNGNFQLLLADEALGTNSSFNNGIVVWDGDPSGPTVSPFGDDYIIPINIPVYAGSASGARQYYFNVVNRSTDPFELTWQLTAHWFENQS